MRFSFRWTHSVISHDSTACNIYIHIFILTNSANLVNQEDSRTDPGKCTHQCDETQGHKSTQVLSTKIVFFGCKKRDNKRRRKQKRGQTRSWYNRQQKKKKAKKRADKKELRDKVARQCPQNTSFEVREKSRSGPSGSEQGPSVCQSDSAGRRAVLCFEDSCDKPFSRWQAAWSWPLETFVSFLSFHSVPFLEGANLNSKL